MIFRVVYTRVRLLTARLPTAKYRDKHVAWTGEIGNVCFADIINEKHEG
jgi:hypothetical protein